MPPVRNHGNGYDPSKDLLSIVEVVALLMAAFIVGENLIMLFFLKDVRKIPSPMKLLIFHLVFVYMLYGIFNLHASAVNLITYHDTDIDKCYVRIASLNFLENVLTYSTLSLMVCCLALGTPQDSVYKRLKQKKTIAIFVALIWLTGGLITVLALTVEKTRWGSVCAMTRGVSRTVCAVGEGLGILGIVLALAVQAWRVMRGVRPVSPDTMPLSTGQHDTSGYQAEANTLVIISITFVVTATPNLAMDVHYAEGGLKITTDDEFTWYTVADILWRFNGILLLPILMCRYQDARDNCKKGMCRKWRLHEFDREVHDNYRRSTVCRQALQDPMRRVSVMTSLHGSLHVQHTLESARKISQSATQMRPVSLKMTTSEHSV